jgi:hypothetical protein
MFNILRLKDISIKHLHNFLFLVSRWTDPAEFDLVCSVLELGVV